MREITTNTNTKLWPFYSILARPQTKTEDIIIFKPKVNIEQILGNPKEKAKLENQGVYSIFRGNRQKTYIGSTY